MPRGCRPAPASALVLAACALSAGCLLRAKKAETPLVGAVRVQGNHAVEEAEILAAIATTDSGRNWLVVKGTPYPFERETLEADSRRILRLYEIHGFFSARVTGTRTVEGDGRVDVTFLVDEGPATLVRELRIDGLDALPGDERRALVDGLPVRVGDRFEEARFETAKALLLERLRARGHAQAEVEAAAHVDPPRQSAVVRLAAGPGPAWRVSQVFVFGAQQISRNRVQDAAAVKPGALFTPQLVAAAQRRVYDLGVFSLVQVEAGAYDRASGSVPIVVTVTEAPLQTVEAGGGVDADATRQVARVRVGYTHRNIARGLQRVNLHGSIGYAFLPNILSPLLGTPWQQRGLVGDAVAEYVQPRVARSPVDLSVALDYAKDVNTSFQYQRAGLRLGFPIHVPDLPRLTLAPSFRFDQYFQVASGNVSAAATPAEIAASGCGPDPSGRVSSTCRLFYGELRTTWDGRDDPVMTRRGVFLTAGLRLAGTPASDFAFASVAPEARAYVPLGRRFVLAARGTAGLLWNWGARDTPGLARFFAGGGTSLRAVGSQQLGPRDFAVIDNPDFGPSRPNVSPYLAGVPVPVGGDRLVEGSLELRWDTHWETPIGPAWLALFVDAASLSLSTAPDSQDARIGPGLGLRVHTPIGPLRVDFAWSIGVERHAPVGVARQLDANRDGRVDQAELDAYERFFQSTTGRTDPTDPSAYGFARSCTGPQPFCFEDGVWQYVVTLGEAF